MEVGNTNEDSNRRIDEELYVLQREIHNCEYCASLRAQMMRLIELRSPDPISVTRELILELMHKREAL